MAQKSRHVLWSAPERSFDIDGPFRTMRSYALVLAEEAEVDVLGFIDPGVLPSIGNEPITPLLMKYAR